MGGGLSDNLVEEVTQDLLLTYIGNIYKVVQDEQGVSPLLIDQMIVVYVSFSMKTFSSRGK